MTQARAPRVLAACADDFGLAPGVCHGIASLARAGRLNATSCLTNASHWRDQAPMLRDTPAAFEQGLHFNLTEGIALSPDLRRVFSPLPSLEALIVRAHLHALPFDAIAAEFAAQTDAFVHATGREPDFVDGHPHVHHLPVVREAVLQGLARWSRLPAVRNTAHVSGPGFGIKRALIAGTGGRALERALRRRGIAHNAVLTGVYDFAPGRYRDWMRGWLDHVPAEGALLFCHPGGPDAPGDAVRDAIASARGPEAEYLGSDAFRDDLAAAHITLGPVWRRVNAPDETSRPG
jgi:predicted glycoside hydrolase/deacetylase ChbG (UPF0249 family)